MVLKDINLENEYGAECAIEKKIIVCAENGNGIRINFLPVKGDPVLNGIRIAKKY
jgi:beta-galactosidase